MPYKRGKTIAEKYAEQEEQQKAKKGQRTREPLTAEQKKKIEHLRQKVAEMNKASRGRRGVEIR